MFALLLGLLPLSLVRVAVAEIDVPLADVRAPIKISADHGSRWRQGVYEVWHLRGRCVIEQAEVTARSEEAVLWIDRAESDADEVTQVLAYLERDVKVDRARRGDAHPATGQAADRIQGPNWFGRFHTASYLQLNVPLTQLPSQDRPAAYHRGMEAHHQYIDTQVRQAQLMTETVPGPQVTPPFAAPPATGAVVPVTPTAPATAAGTDVSVRRVQVRGRSRDVGLVLSQQLSPDGRESILTLDQGVRVIIEGVTAPSIPELGTLVLEADRMVVWTDPEIGLNLQGGESLQSGQQKLEIYMEGNIVFLQGDRVIYAERMYYNVPARYGVLLAAEAWTPVPEYEGLVRLKAEVLQQVNEQNFVAYGAALTSSRLGVPQYWVQSDTVTFQDIQRPVVDPITGQAAIDPATGQPVIEHDLLATSRNNFLYILRTPVLYWPVLSTDLTEPTYYIESVRINNDSIFGTQVLTEFNVYQLLGVRDIPEGTEWDLSLDYLSERGFGVGTSYSYQRDSFLGIPGAARGFIDAWGIHDSGRDTLGLDRRELEPETELRGRVLAQHRQNLAGGYQVTGELGLISDRNFLEQYYEQEWDTMGDQPTRLELKRFVGNSTYLLEGQVRVNDFFTQTEWLPRVDHYLIGESLLFDQLTWYAHSHAGYGRLKTASRPENPADAAKFDPLAWEADREGIHAATRQELDLPLNLGYVKVVPYVLGEIAHWGEDLRGEEVTRTYGQVGVRTSLPMWTVDPTVQSVLLNLNGLAHKVTFESEFFWAEASEDLDRFPLYEPLDDDSIEHFRRRFFFDTFNGMPGGNVPLRFDERYFALRSGLQNHVTSPSTEIADDLALGRLAVRQRWQTKRGLPTQPRIVDWITLDIEGSVFPKPERDNFGEEVGLLGYDFRWHVGDRLTLLSDGFADVFADGLRTISIGSVITRPGLGDAFLGIRSIEGPISSNVVLASLNYRMSEKWIFTASTSFDLGPTGNIGQSLAFTRIGESALVRLGVNVDEGRDNVGVAFAIEPRFLPRGDLGRLGGVSLPPVGAFGLE